MKAIKRIVLVSSLTLIATTAEAQKCFVVDAVWQAGHVGVEQGLNARVALMTTNLARERAITLELLVGATKVHTRQQSLNAERETAMEKNTQEAVASTLTEQDRREKLIHAKEQYSFESGQGVAACDTVDLIANTQKAFDNVLQNAKKGVKDVDTAPGMATPLADAVKARLKAKDDVDASVLFTSGSKEAGKNIIQHLSGLPLPFPDKSMNGADADLALIRARRVEALRSPALVSLNYVRSMSSTDGHETGSTGAKSPNDMLDELIDRYGGGDQYNDWSTKLVSQSERGLLLELARLRAISLQLRQQQIAQQGRLTVLYSTMLSLESAGDL